MSDDKARSYLELMQANEATSEDLSEIIDFLWSHNISVQSEAVSNLRDAVTRLLSQTL